LEGIEPPTERTISESNDPLPPTWKPESLQGWVNDAKDQEQKTLRLMPLMTLVTSGLNTSSVETMSLLELLVSILENKNPSCPVQNSLEKHCSRCNEMEEENKQKKKQKTQQVSSSSTSETDTPMHVNKDAETRHDDSTGTQHHSEDDSENENSENEGETETEVPNHQARKQCDANKDGEAKSRTPQRHFLKDIHEAATNPKTKASTQSRTLEHANLESMKAEFANNDSVIPKTLVKLLNNSVKGMARRHFGINAGLSKTQDDKEGKARLETFYSDVEGRAARTKINEEMIGEAFAVIAKHAARHADEFPRKEASMWNHVAGHNNLKNTESSDISTPVNLQRTGRKLLGRNDGMATSVTGANAAKQAHMTSANDTTKAAPKVSRVVAVNLKSPRTPSDAKHVARERGSSGSKSGLHESRNPKKRRPASTPLGLLLAQKKSCGVLEDKDMNSEP
jgi:hypothetical protein